MGVVSRRKYERISTNIPCTIYGLKDFGILCKIRDVSENGVGLYVSKQRYFSQTIRRGDCLEVDFCDFLVYGETSREVRLSVEATVAFIQEDDDFFAIGCEVKSPEYFEYVSSKKQMEGQN